MATHAKEATATKARSTGRWDDAREQQFREWYRRVCAAEQGHRKRAGTYYMRHLLFGIPVVVFSTVVGTSIFASLQDANVRNVGLRVLIGAVSVLAAILSSLQTFLGYAQRSERHRIASLRYESLRREMEQKLATPVAARGDANITLSEIRGKMDRYGKESPQIGIKMWESLEKKYDVHSMHLEEDREVRLPSK